MKKAKRFRNVAWIRLSRHALRLIPRMLFFQHSQNAHNHLQPVPDPLSTWLARRSWSRWRVRTWFSAMTALCTLFALPLGGSIRVDCRSLSAVRHVEFALESVNLRLGFHGSLPDSCRSTRVDWQGTSRLNGRQMPQPVQLSFW